MKAPITESAFFKYLLQLPLEPRAKHLIECGLNGGELFYELAEHYNEYNPIELAKRLEDV